MLVAKSMLMKHLHITMMLTMLLGMMDTKASAYAPFLFLSSHKHLD